MYARERQRHFGLHSRRPHDPAPGGLPGHVLEQSRLPDPRLAAQDQHRALARSYALQLQVQRFALVAPAEQHPHTLKRSPVRAARRQKRDVPAIPTAAF
jgi:hypothetical protein